MRFAYVVAFLVPAAAFADRVFTVPTGRKLLYRQARAEVVMPTANFDRPNLYLGYGIGPAWELEARYGSFGQFGKRVGTGDISYNFMSPIVGLSPGISVGVRDVANVTKLGLQGYAALTLRQVAELDTGDSYLDLSLGVAVGRRFSTIMVGASLPLSTRVRLLGEHNGQELTVGAEWRIVPSLALRGYLQEGKTVISVASYFRF